MGKKRTIQPEIIRTYDDAFEAFNDIVIKGKKSTTGFGSLGSAAASKFRGYNTGFGKSKYDEGLDWNANIDEEDIQGSINEYRSQQQGGWGELGAGTARVVSKVGRELTKTVGAIGGLAVGLAGNTSDLFTGEDTTDLLATTFNNSFIKATDKAFDNANSEYLPVYVSDTVTNGGFFDKVTSGEFWATEGADGVGYLISAFAPGAALKALGASNKLFGGLAKLNSLRYGKSLDVSRRALSMAGVTIDKIDNIVIPMANTFFEAGAQSKGAADGMDAKRSEMEANYPSIQLQRLQEVDTRRKNGEISIEEANALSNEISNKPFEVEFNEQKSKAARNTFLTNLMILAGPNYIQSKIIYGKNGATNLLNNVTKKGPIKQGLKRVGESFLTEGSEEVAQTSTEHRNVERGLKGELSDTFAEDVNPLTFGKDFVKSLGTTEGQVTGFLGGILGSPISVVQGFRQDSKDQIKNDKLRGKIQTTGTSLNDIHLPIYQTEISKHPGTGEEIEIYKEDETGNKILIPENVAKVKQALDLHEEISTLYDDAVERGDVDAVDRIKKYGEHELIMNFVGEDEMTIDALQEHLKVTMPVEGVDPKTAKENLKRQSEIIDKAKYLQKELVSFKDMSTSLVKLNNKSASKAQVAEFMNTLSNEFIKETSEIYDNKQKLDGLLKTKTQLERNTLIEEVDNPLYQEGLSNELDKTTTVRTNPRLDLINSKIKEVKKEISDASSFLDYGIWNSKIVNGAFDTMINSDAKLKNDTSPEVVKTSDDILDSIKNATTLSELDAIDRQNNPGFSPYYNSKKAELEAAITSATVDAINQETADKEAQQLENYENEQTVKSYSKNSKVNDVELDPFTLRDAIITDITKTSVTLTDVETNEAFTYEFQEDISDDNSADDVDPTKVSVIPAGATYSDHKTVGYENDNPEFAEYLMEPRNKIGDIVTFELDENNLTDESQKALKAIKDNNDLAGNRQLLIDSLKIRFVYNGGQAKSWSLFTGMNAVKLRTNIVDAIINGAKLSELRTVVINQESASFNTKFENGKPVVNNPLDIDFIKTLDNDNPENKVTLYHVNSEGVLVIVSNNKLPLSAETKKDLTAQKGQIFIVIKNPNGGNVPVKLNFSRLNETKASTLARLYGEILNDQTLRTRNLITLKDLNPGLFNEILKSFESELEILGNNPATININHIIQMLVHEDSTVDKSITFNSDIEGNSAILFNGSLYNNGNIDELGVALQSKYHNIITITKDKSDNENLNFKNPIYLKYLFDKGILSTNLNTEGHAFKQFTTKEENPGERKNVGSELWISSVVESIATKSTISTSTTQNNKFVLQNGESFIDKQIDAKGRTYTKVSIVKEKSGLKTTKFLFNRSDKPSDQRNPTSISVEQFSKDFGFKIPKDSAPEGTEVTRVKEIRETDKAIGATVTLKDIESGESWDAEIVIKRSTTEVKPVVNNNNVINENQTRINDIILLEKSLEGIIANRVDELPNSFFKLLEIVYNEKNLNSENYYDRLKSAMQLSTLEMANMSDFLIRLRDSANYKGLMAKLNTVEIKPVETKPVINTISKQELIKSKIDEYNKLVTDILSKRKEGQDSIKGPDYVINRLGNLVKDGIGVYTDEGFNPGDGVETYEVIKEFISETIENNYENILQSQKNVVSLPSITITNNMDTPGTQDNIDYKEAFKNLKVEGDNLLLQEDLERSLNLAVKNVELFKTTNPTLVSKFEKIVEREKAKLVELAENIKKQQKC